jgi:hypothetical protein
MHFAPHTLHYFNCGHLLHIWVDHVEPRTEDQAEQVQWVFGDPQASSYEDTNNCLGSRQARCINQCYLSFIFKYIFMFYFDCVLSL